MPDGDHCCVPECTSDRRQKEKGILFHSFPGSSTTKTGKAREVSTEEKEVRARWKAAIRRDEKAGVFRVVDYQTVVCSDHFSDESYVQGIKKPGAKLKSSAVPTIFSWSTHSAKRKAPAERFEPTPKKPREPQSDTARAKFEKNRADQLAVALAEAQAELKDVESDWGLKMFSLARFQDNDSDIQYYTGFPTMSAFTSCAEFLNLSEGNAISYRSKSSDSNRRRARGGGRKSRMSLMEKFFITMVRLRRGLEFRLLGDLYLVDAATISRIVHTMINYLYLRLGMIPIWPTPEQVSKRLPDVFKELYPTTFAVIDATEIKCEAPSSLPAQSQVYSAYKSHTTLKGLIAMAPDGAVTFVSELFGGSISDRELVIKSHFLDLLPAVGYGCSIMADKGFDIQDLLIPYGVKLNIPPFKKSGQQMTAADVQRTQRIAKVRIHIERLMERIKEFQIFSRIIPVTLFPIVNQMWAVCCLLTLFQAPLLAEQKQGSEESAASGK